MTNAFIVNAYLPLKQAGFMPRTDEKKFVLNISGIAIFGEFIYSNTTEYQHSNMNGDGLPPEVHLLVPDVMVNYTYYPARIVFDKEGKLTVGAQDLFYDSEIDIPHFETHGIKDYFLHNCQHNINLIFKHVAKEMKNENI